MSIFEDGNRLTASAVEQLNANADMIDCECPTRLIEILLKVRAFTDYTTDCIDRFPNDQKTHQWLRTSSLNLDSLLSATISQLARIEGFIGENNEFIKRK